MTRLLTRFGALVLCLAMLGTSGWPQPLQADVLDAVAIARVLSEPSQFNLEVVTLIGTIREIRPIRVEAECGTGTGFIIYLRDETGELAIANQGTCVDGGYLPALPGQYARGERVVVRAAIIEHPDHPADRSPLEASLVRIDRVGD